MADTISYKGFVLRRAAGNIYLLDVTKKEMTERPPLRLNETGVVVFEGLAKGLSKEQISEELAVKFNVSFSEIYKDTDDFCNALKAYGVPIA